MQLKDGLFVSDLLTDQPVVHGFTTRAFGNLGFGKNPGDPEVIANRLRLFEARGLIGRIHIQPKQVHSNRAVSSLQFSPGCEADACFTSDRTDLLSVLTADCVPLLMYFPERTVAAIHAGWRGLFHEIIPNTLSQLPEGGVAAIGPAIGVCCYEVSMDMADDFEKKFGSGIVDRTREKPHLDLAGVAMRQLELCDVEEIETANICTHCHPELFFSYRRDGSSGRMMSFVGLSS